LRGEQLYGDDFGPDEIEAWFRDEANAYFRLGAKDLASYIYPYQALDQLHGYSVLPKKKYRHVLGIGSAYGDELIPIASEAGQITILEPFEGFAVPKISGTPVEYVKPHPSGELPFDDRKFDLVTCLSVLHHIPNVSRVVGEIFRCLSPGGFALVREPVISMGDWRRPRKGLTKRERGIPLPIIRKIFNETGFQVLRERACVFPITRRLGFLSHSSAFNSAFLTRLDAIICRLPLWPRQYHPRWFFQKLRPSAAFFVLVRPI